MVSMGSRAGNLGIRLCRESAAKTFRPLCFSICSTVQNRKIPAIRSNHSNCFQTNGMRTQNWYAHPDCAPSHDLGRCTLRREDPSVGSPVNFRMRRQPPGRGFLNRRRPEIENLQRWLRRTVGPPPGSSLQSASSSFQSAFSNVQIQPTNVRTRKGYAKKAASRRLAAPVHPKKFLPR